MAVRQHRQSGDRCRLGGRLVHRGRRRRHVTARRCSPIRAAGRNCRRSAAINLPPASPGGAARPADHQLLRIPQTYTATDSRKQDEFISETKVFPLHDGPKRLAGFGDAATQRPDGDFRRLQMILADGLGQSRARTASPRLRGQSVPPLEFSETAPSTRWSTPHGSPQ